MRWTIVLPILCMPLQAQVSLAGAIEAALARHPQLQVERERVTIARTLIGQATAAFDPVVEARGQHSATHTPLTGLARFQVTQAGLGITNQASNNTSANFSVGRLQRNGMQLSANLDMQRVTDNLVQTQGLDFSRFRFQLNVPLLRGRGRAVVEASERAARIEADSTVFELNHLAASLAADCAMRYWELVAARRSLDVYTQAEERGRALVENVRALISGGRLPRAEIQQALANLAGRSVARAAAEQRVVDATQALALAMGTAGADMAAAIDPSDPLPGGESASMPVVNPSDWITHALARRGDYLAERERSGAFDARRTAAENELKARLDLQLATGFSGLAEGRRPDKLVISPFSRVGGVDAIGGLSYTLPVGRRAGQERLRQAIAESRQNQLRASDLERNIASAVLAGIGAYRTALLRVREAKLSVEASQAALDGEREKLRLGAGSVVDLVTMEDRLTNARAAQVDAALNHAVLVAKLRFAAGAILDPRGVSHVVDRGIFSTPPWEDGKP